MLFVTAETARLTIFAAIRVGAGRRAPVDRRPPPPGILMRDPLLQWWGRDAPVGDRSPSP